MSNEILLLSVPTSIYWYAQSRDLRTTTLAEHVERFTSSRVTPVSAFDTCSRTSKATSSKRCTAHARVPWRS